MTWWECSDSFSTETARGHPTSSCDGGGGLPEAGDYPWIFSGLHSAHPGLLIDPSFVVGIDRYQRPGDRNDAHTYYLGGAITLWLAWLLAIGAGATLGAQLPAALHLEFVIPLYLVGEIVPKLADRATRRAALTAAVVAVVAISAPMHLGVVLAIVAGLGAALTVKEGKR